MPLTLYVSPARPGNLKGVRKKIPHAQLLRKNVLAALGRQPQCTRTGQVSCFLEFSLTNAQCH